MSTPPASAASVRVILDAIGHVNPYRRDDPPPDPPIPVRQRRVYGAAGALLAIALMVWENMEVLEGPTTNWYIGISAFIVVGFMHLGSLIGVALTERASYKVVLGALFSTLAAILVSRIFITGWTFMTGIESFG